MIQTCPQGTLIKPIYQNKLIQMDNFFFWYLARNAQTIEEIDHVKSLLRTIDNEIKKTATDEFGSKSFGGT